MSDYGFSPAILTWLSVTEEWRGVWDIFAELGAVSLSQWSPHMVTKCCCISSVTDPVCTSTGQVETDKFSHLGGSWITVAWPHNLIVFTCISMPVWISELAATSKSCIWNEGSKMHPVQGAKNLQGHGSSSYNTLSVPALHEKIVWSAGKVAWLISSCCHPFLAPAWAAVHRAPTMGAPWEICKMIHPHSGQSCGFSWPWSTALHIHAVSLTHFLLPGHWLRSSPTRWDRGQPQQKTFRRKSAMVRHLFLLGRARCQAALPFPGCRVGRAAALQCPGTTSTETPSTVAPKMPRSFKRHLKAPHNSCGPSALWNYP